jgi:hypothetical protein
VLDFSSRRVRVLLVQFCHQSSAARRDAAHSAYFPAASRAALKDIKELFMDTGVGTAA